MTEIGLSTSGPSETVLPAISDEVRSALAEALSFSGEAKREALSAIVAKDPSAIDGWAHLGGVARDDVEAYAAFRVGYHRGLDHLRKNGWRGSGYVRWEHETNRGFLIALDGLREMAGKLGESDEEQRCALFLRQLDPTWQGIG